MVETYQSAVDPRKMKELTGLQPWRTLAALALDWLTIMAAILAAEYFQNLFVYLLAVLIIGGRMHGLGVLMHEFSHYRFSSNRALSEWLGNILSAWPIGTTVNSYRLNHLAHHQHTNTDKDPDWVAKLNVAKYTFPRPIGKILTVIAGYLVAIESIIDLKSILARVNKSDADSKALKLARLGFYLAVAIALTWTQSWIGFLIYWLIPYLTAFMLCLYVRSVAEHFGSMDYGRELGATRSVAPLLWERLFFCPHNINYHLEHHLYPGVPFYNLPALQNVLMEDPKYRAEAHLTRGYSTGVLRECTG